MNYSKKYVPRKIEVAEAKIVDLQKLLEHQKQIIIELDQEVSDLIDERDRLEEKCDYYKRELLAFEQYIEHNNRILSVFLDEN